MKNKGYVDITPSPNDKRAVNITITERGKQVSFEAAKKGIIF